MPVILSAAEQHSPVILTAAGRHSPVILSAAKDMGIAESRPCQIHREVYSERPQILRCAQDDNSQCSDDNSEWADDNSERADDNSAWESAAPRKARILRGVYP